MLTKWLDRRTVEATLLAVVAVAAVVWLRMPVESRWHLTGEMTALASATVLSLLSLRRGRQPAPGLGAALVVIPIIAAAVGRFTGSPSPTEMSMLTSLGGASLALAVYGDRTRSMSLVASGFLTLFAVVISDHPQAVVLAIVWITICVWHLVANHWERLELCRVEEVRRSGGVRPVSVLVAVGLCMVGGWAVRDRFADPQRFTFGIMPTSGGSRWSDPAARRGVGNGDAAIAAKDHAESFGAVESDLFLETTESTMFDMFSDSIGEPKRKNIWERRQGLTNQNVIQVHHRTAKSEKGGGSFSTDRLPPKAHRELVDAAENAVVQWVGPTGIRLGTHRYDQFDGVEWSSTSNLGNDPLVRHETNGEAWLFDPTTMRRALSSRQTSVGLLKVLRLDSTRLPTPMLTSGLHIKDVDGPDFFAMDGDGSFIMPGREKVPPMTVVNLASTSVMEDELWKTLRAGQPDPLVPPEIASLTSVAAGVDPPYEKLTRIVAHLRGEFVFDRNSVPTSDDPLAEFLAQRRGGDHWFATAAALAARQIGLTSRLVTGFYVRPASMDVGAGHTNVLPTDVHVWAEVQLADGRWFEIEPTPGYQAPVYRPTWWLATKQFAARHWATAAALGVGVIVLVATRLVWIDWVLSLAARIGVTLWPRRRFKLVMHVLQARARLAGCPRATGCPQRDWLIGLTMGSDSLRDHARAFCDAADRAVFGGDAQASLESSIAHELLTRLKIKTLRSRAAEVVA